MPKKSAKKRKPRKQNPLTDPQRKAILFIRQYYLDNDNLPSVRTIQAYMGYASSNAVTILLKAFVKKKWIEKVPGVTNQYRFYRGKYGAFQQEEKRKQLEQENTNDNTTDSNTTTKSDQSIFVPDVGRE